MSISSLKNLFHELPKLKRLHYKAQDVQLITLFNDIKDQYFPPHIAKDIRAVEVKYKTLVVACLSHEASERVRDAQHTLLQMIKHTNSQSHLEKIICIW